MDSQPKCPQCGSVIYSRRNPVCGRCGEKLPESLMFNAATRKKIEAELQNERKRQVWESKFSRIGDSTHGSPML